MLEPCDGKLSSTVLRGERGCKAPDLLGLRGGNNEVRPEDTSAIFFNGLVDDTLSSRQVSLAKRGIHYLAVAYHDDHVHLIASDNYFLIHDELDSKN